MKQTLRSQIITFALPLLSLLYIADLLVLPACLRSLLPGISERQIGDLAVAVGAAGAVSGLAVLILSLRAVDRAAPQLRQLSAAMRRIEAGDLTSRVRARTPDEAGELVRSFNSMSGTLEARMAHLHETETTMRAAFAHMADGVVVLDPNGSVLLFNRIAEEAFGMPADRAQGRTLLEIALHPELDALVSRAMRTGIQDSAEIQLRRPAPRTLRAYVTPVPWTEGAPLGAVLVFQDLTEIRRLENVRRDFVTNASHELRTPLATIHVMVDILRSGLPDDPQTAERFLGTIGAEVERMGALIDDLLDLSRIEAGNVPLDQEVISLRGLLESVKETFLPAAEKRGQTLRGRFEDGILVWGDSGAIIRMAGNLLENALKYTSDGGGIEIGCGLDGGEACFWVEDDGIGIAESEQSRIFERFYRVDRARSRATGGTGLGLSIVRHLAEAHDGRVEVRSAPGRGSRFTVRLPAFPIEEK